MELLRADDPVHAVGVLAHSLKVVETVQAASAGLLDHLPGSRLLGVVLGSHRPDHVAREAPHLRLELELVLVEREVHGRNLLIAVYELSRPTD